ncbi:hypothetical protein FHW89_002702 [Mucilaginibacter sp. SG564]|nr:hypothetical protein [Mucilaginibacter sp. SG564]
MTDNKGAVKTIPKDSQGEMDLFIAEFLKYSMRLPGHMLFVYNKAFSPDTKPAIPSTRNGRLLKFFNFIYSGKRVSLAVLDTQFKNCDNFLWIKKTPRKYPERPIKHINKTTKTLNFNSNLHLKNDIDLPRQLIEPS